jgi:YVTN family beta-propeller protein
MHCADSRQGSHLFRLAIAASCLVAVLVACGGGATDILPAEPAGANGKARILSMTPQQAALARWSAPIALPLVPVSGAVLDSSRVLFWAAGPADAAASGSAAQTAIFDTVTQLATSRVVATSGQDFFCPGTARLADGRLLINGGSGDAAGASKTTLYDPASDTWSAAADMNTGRGYNASVPLADGSVLTVGGSYSGAQGAKPAELFTLGSGWRTLPGISTAEVAMLTEDSRGIYRSDNHMWLIPAGNGLVLHAGPSQAMHWLDVSGDGSVTPAGLRGADNASMNGNAVMYDAGRILTLGGSPDYDNRAAKNAAFVIDTNRGRADVRAVSAMAYPRVFANSVVLPNGQVVVIGGQTFSVLFSDDNAVLAAELFDPETETFTTLPAMAVPRNYHSIGLLLPDARVVSAGGGLCACAADHADMQILSPPYLFNADGSAATRPLLTNAPATVAYGSDVAVTTDSPVTAFAMVRLGAATHTVNNDQRRVALSFTAGSGNNYQVAIPSNPGVLLPGQWMLFAMSAQGTPSVARIVTVSASGAPVLKNPGSVVVPAGGSATVALLASTGSGSLRFSASALPPGMAINPASGVISGTPSVPGSYYTVVSAGNGTATVSTGFTLEVLGNAAADGSGLLGEYFDTAVAGAAPAVRRAEAPNFDWGTAAAAPGLPADGFSVRWSGWIDGTGSAPTLLQTQADGGVRVWIDEQLVIDAWALQAAGVASATLRLDPGKRHSIAIDYRKGTGNGSFRLLWQPPGATTLAAVPANRLYPLAALAATNLALGKPATQSSTYDVASANNAVDGNTSNLSHTAGATAQDWWQVDLGVASRVDTVQLWNRSDCCFDRLQHFVLLLSDTDMTGRTLEQLTADPAVVVRRVDSGDAGPNFAIPVHAAGRFVRVQLTGWNELELAATKGWRYLNLAEVQVFGATTFSQPTLAAVADRSGTVGAGASLFAVASDPAGGALVYGATDLPVGLSINPATGEISGSYAAPGSYAVSLSATNGSALAASRRFVWTVTDALPMLTSLPAPAAASGALVSYAPVLGSGLPAQYSWNFGDGSADTAFAVDPAASHVFAAPGVYTVTLNIRGSDGSSRTQRFVQAVYGSLNTTLARASSSLLLEPRSGGVARLWVVNADSNTVSVFETAGHSRLAEIGVGDGPRSVALAADGRVWVTNKRDASVSVISPETLAVVQTVALPRASQPYGVVVSPLDGSVFVALEASGRLLKLDGSSGAQRASLDVGANPRHLALAAAGDKLLVSRFITPPLPGEGSTAVQTSDAGGNALGGEVLLVNPATMSLGKTLVLRHSDKPDAENQGRGIPNYLGAAAIAPDGSSAWVPSKQDNVKRGGFRDGNALNFQSTVRAVSSRIDLAAQAEDAAARVDHDNAGVASAAVYHPNGVYLFVALETNRQLAVLDAAGRRELFRFEVGLAPQGLVVAADGSRLYVSNFMSRSVSVVDLQPLVLFGQIGAATTLTLAATAREPLAAAVLKGKQLFYDARDPKLARDSYLSCASCHNEAGHDGRTWDFSSLGEGLRNTVALQGRAGPGHGFMHWSANFDEVQDFEGQIRGLASGTGLLSDAQFASGTRSQPLGDRKAGLSADLDALAAYVGSLATFAPSPWRNADATLSVAAQAGKTVFTASCASCHGGAGFNGSGDASQLKDIGTLKASSGQRLGGPLAGIDIPTLRDAWATAPYLHDGSAPTLSSAIASHNGLGLSTTDTANVAAYVQQIGNDEPAAAVNLALGKPATSSNAATAGDAARAVDGNTDGVYANNSVTLSTGTGRPWWQVDLGQQSDIRVVRLWNRTDCCADRLANFYVFVSASSMSNRTLAQLKADTTVAKVLVASLNGAASVALPLTATGRYVKVQLVSGNTLSLAEVQVLGAPLNLALGKPATSSPVAWGGDPARAVDGNTDGVYAANSVSHTDIGTQSWWQVDLGQVSAVQSVQLFNRTDCCVGRLSDFRVLVSVNDMAGRTLAQLLADPAVTQVAVVSMNGGASVGLTLPGSSGRYVRVQLAGTDYLSLAEVQVFGR